MVKGKIFDLQGKLLRPDEISVYLLPNGGYFEMPESPVRTGNYQLQIEDRALQPIFVYATSHVDGYFRFVSA
jgi:hypothetical protein